MSFSLGERLRQMGAGIVLAVVAVYFFWYLKIQNIAIFAEGGITNSITIGVAAGLFVWSIFRFPLVYGALVAIEEIRRRLTDGTRVSEVVSLGVVAIIISPPIVGFMSVGQFYISVGFPKLLNLLPLISISMTNSAVASVYASVFVALLSNAAEVYSREK